MKQWMTRMALVLAGTLVVVGCQPAQDFWFAGDFEAARAEAREGGTLVMLDFYTDWCSWCKRLDRDTFSDDRVQTELAELVALRVNAEKGGEELAERYAVDGYPTIVFTDAEGHEVDRLVGYFPPDKFAEEVRRIRTGDTFAACLARFESDPTNLDALERAVTGLLERADPEAALAQIESYTQASANPEHSLCRRLLFAARAAVLDREYAAARRHYRSGAEGRLEVPDRLGTLALRQLFADSSFATLTAEAQAEALREARRSDAGAILEAVPRDELEPEEGVELADFAYSNGHYDLAAELYARWFDGLDRAGDAAELNRISWRMYLMQKELPTALAMARRAYELDPDPNVADTVARILYLQGETEEAIALETSAAEASEDKQADDFREAVAVMRAGGSFDDKPSFEFFPGEKD